MSTSTIAIEEISALSKLGRIAVRHSAEFGQTEVGAHCAVSAERRIVIEARRESARTKSGSALTIYSAREAGGTVFFDPATGARVGAMATLRVLRDRAEPLEGGTVVRRGKRRVPKGGLLRGAA